MGTDGRTNVWYLSAMTVGWPSGSISWECKFFYILVFLIRFKILGITWPKYLPFLTIAIVNWSTRLTQSYSWWWWLFTRIVHPCGHPSVRPSQLFKMNKISLPSGLWGWLCESLMTPVLFCFFFEIIVCSCEDQILSSHTYYSQTFSHFLTENEFCFWTQKNTELINCSNL